jgi:hypothetical protein
MKILFFVHTLGRTRHFRNVVSGLVERGHVVILAATGEAVTQPRRQGLYAHERIDVVPCPMERTDRWAAVAEPLRRARDYMRFFDPRYAASDRLAARAAEHAPQGWTRALARHPWMKRHWRGVQRALAIAENVIPCDPGFAAFIDRYAPDAIMVTPLVEFGSYQTDYIKCAHQLGIPAIYLPFSWDNLTNRGLIRVAPDRTLVWNEGQRQEAIELHGLPEDSVVVTGAPRFDEFFTMTPRSAREAFFGELGLDPSRALVLYVCSAQFIAPREVAFVRRWIGALRAAPEGSWLREAQVLVRPHPANQDEWETADLSDLRGVAVWSKRSSIGGDQGLFDSLHHAVAVVGLNTSAMIEAAIVGRAVFTITTPEFSGGQGGTLHFWHLLVDNGGVVASSASFEEHVAQLAAAPAHVDEAGQRSRRFLASFVRPRGLDVLASSVMVDEIERAVALAKQPRRAPLWHYPVRWGLDAAVRAGFDPSLKRYQ